MDNEKTVNEIKSTVQAFTEWLDTNSDEYLMLVSKGDSSILAAKGDTNSDEYLMLVSKGDSSILAAKGDTDRIVMGLVLGSMQDKRLTYIIQRAARVIDIKNTVDMLIGEKK